MPAKSTENTAEGAALWGLSSEAFQSLVQANTRVAELWLESWAKLASESASFVGRRWKQDLDLLERLRACKTPLELLQLQSEFLQKAAVDYMTETGKIADMETDAGVSEIEALDAGAKEARRPAKPTARK